MEYKDYYATLGVDRKATQDAIKHAYRRLARKYHPDVSKEKDAEEKFKNLQEAYEVLKDSQKRSAYDQLGSNWKAGQEFRPPPDWDSSSRFYTSGDFGDFSTEDLGGFSDFFTNLFGQARTSGFGRRHAEARQQRGRDQHAKINISLEDAYHGGTKTLQLQIPEVDPSGRMHQKVRTLKVNIPAGAVSGQQLRLAQQGSPGFAGGPPGDIYLEMEVVPDPRFSLEGHDIYLTVPISPWEAALGATIKIPTLGGNVELKLAANSQAGQKLRLKGRGMPSKPTPGDQYAILQIVVPPVHHPEERELYEKMAKITAFNPRKNW